MGFYDAFFGSDQSLYTAYAIIAAIISICVTILFTSTDVPVGSRLLMILFVVITLVPSIFLTLFEITCIVTGGTEPNNWWCYTFGWILAAFIIIYCIFVVIISIISLVTYNKAIDNVNNDEEKNKVNPQEANNIAKQIMATQKPVEKFYDSGNNYDANPLNNMTDMASSFAASMPSMPSMNSIQSNIAAMMGGEMHHNNDNTTHKEIAKFDNLTGSEDDNDDGKENFYNATKNIQQFTVPEKSSPPAKANFTNIEPAHNSASFFDYINELPNEAGNNTARYPDIFTNN